ncbi:hypothetical protein GCM10009865_27970 [Aeromicrobium ponti]|uniref:Allantoate deiminase n=1 Tax=Cytobacillus oceanisediminis TaxID=665099 RepID=A0A562JS13_9BACI|nr:allantoate deiminase [Cytobacillus oceanisediminis]
MAGLLAYEHLQKTDASGISIEEAMKQSQLSPLPLEKIKRNDIQAYLEMHIEQGKVLENEELPVGIVTGIAAPLWLEVTVTGVSAHAGATPMPIRKDALAAASEMILAIEQMFNDRTNSVTTVGKLNVEPNGVNVIPGRVTFTIDIRDIDEQIISTLEGSFLRQMQKIAERRKVTLKTKMLQLVKPAKTDPMLQQQLAKGVLAALIYFSLNLFWCRCL